MYRGIERRKTAKTAYGIVPCKLSLAVSVIRSRHCNGETTGSSTSVFKTIWLFYINIYTPIMRIRETMAKVPYLNFIFSLNITTVIDNIIIKNGINYLLSDGKSSAKSVYYLHSRSVKDRRQSLTIVTCLNCDWLLMYLCVCLLTSQSCLRLTVHSRSRTMASCTTAVLRTWRTYQLLNIRSLVSPPMLLQPHVMHQVGHLHASFMVFIACGWWVGMI